uniref:Uncharacterized protein n=1 Tax=Heliothis virescens TaxID=7102 RepID=A0A2A4J013_HELVI
MVEAILIATTLFSLALCDDQLVAVEFSLPDVLSSVISVDEVLRTIGGGDVEMETSNTLMEDMMMKVQWNAYDYITKFLNLQRRKTQPIPRVEYGPGAHKTEIVKFPKNYLAKRLKALLKIKQKKEERNKKS